MEMSAPRPLSLALTCLAVIASACMATAQFQYLSPKPGAVMISPEHDVLIRQGDPMMPGSVSKDLFDLRGSKSGYHDFSISLSSDGRTIILNPLCDFEYNEQVTVTIHPGLKTLTAKLIDDYSFSFTTHREYSPSERERMKSRLKNEFLSEVRSGEMQHALATVRSPLEGSFEIKVNSDPSPGEILFDSWNGVVWSSIYDGYHIITPGGDSVYSSAGTRNRVFDWDLNPNGYLSYWNIDVPCFDVLDSNYNLIDQYVAANGYFTDPHEFTMYKDGHVFLIAEETQIVDMTVYHPAYYDSCLLTGTLIQEFDEKKNLVFEWRSLDHVAITETNQPLYYDWLDYIHTNSIEIDSDGHIIASHRHLDQVTKIDRNTGEFIWRLGGQLNEFTFINDEEQFNYQHDARRLANGNLTIWDNGNKHPVPHSSAKEYLLDEVNKTATLVWSFTPYDSVSGKPVYFLGMGNVQRLENGNTFINGGWDSGQPQSNMWEVTPEGKVVWELKLNDDAQLVTYRAHKRSWKPCAPAGAGGIRFTGLSSRTANLEWRRVSNASSYEFQYRKIGELDWIKLVTVDTTATLYYLFPETAYEYQLRAVCLNEHSSDWTAADTFTTALSSLYPEENVFRLQAYPVPARDIITLEWSYPIVDDLAVRVYHIDGHMMLHTVVHLNLDMIKATLSISGFPQGFYLLEAESSNRHFVFPFAIQR
jgi:hypothetical protein